MATSDDQSEMKWTTRKLPVVKSRNGHNAGRHELLLYGVELEQRKADCGVHPLRPNPVIRQGEDLSFASMVIEAKEVTANCDSMHLVLQTYWWSVSLCVEPNSRMTKFDHVHSILRTQQRHRE
jgi:hypothetical protein